MCTIKNNAMDMAIVSETNLYSHTHTQSVLNVEKLNSIQVLGNNSVLKEDIIKEIVFKNCDNLNAKSKP